jgi:cytochrome c2
MTRRLFKIGIALIATAAVGGCSKLGREQLREVSQITDGGDAKAGRRAIRKYGCPACHTISGVPGARGLVGPPLNGMAERSYIAGELPNTPANLMHWIQHPHEVEPHTVMPEMNVTEDDSRDIAAYLYLLHSKHSYFNF